ncbi:S41 family peptidase [Barnesiella viscericola]|uniref:S41 family peptidase n=1 Tax=Barnesiella viscericola TaxID=397865 RepID=UPI0023525C03|nr:S41 family peptidase [Barnesiella viscericola]
MKKCLFAIALVGLFAIQVPAKAQTTTNERIYILSSVWKDVCKNFAFPERFKEVDPDSLYKEYIPKVLHAESEQHFSNLMAEFLSSFQDGHTKFNDNNIKRYKVPVVFSWVKDQLFVTNIPTALKQEIPLGSQIVEVEGEPLMDYLQKQVYPIVPASNENWRKRKALDFFLTGDKDTRYNCSIKTPNGEMKEVSLTTGIIGYEDISDWLIQRDNRICYVKNLPGDILYMKLTTFAKPQSVKEEFEKYLSQFISSKGVIFDIRGNRGGTDESWHNLIQYIADSDVNIQDGLMLTGRVSNTAIELYEKNVPQLADYYNGVAMQPIQLDPFKSKIPDSLRIKSPIILLVDGFTASAAEDFAVTMKNLKLATIVGTSTAGVVSSPKENDHGHGYWSQVSFCRFSNPDGSDIIYTGVLPDTNIEYTLNDALGKTDTALDTAINIIHIHQAK